MRPWLLVSAALLSGCGFNGAEGQRPDGTRLVVGTLIVPDEDLLGRQVTGLQVAALAVQSATKVQVFPSAVFDASRVENARFVTPVDDDRSFFLVLQVPSASGRGPGAFLGLLEFADGHGGLTELFPPGRASENPAANDVDLGAVAVRIGPKKPQDNRLLVGDANHPLSQLDTDGDGLTDLQDDDDDDDGVPDAADGDVGGDGIDDALQRWSTLPDTDGDGVPDLLAGT